jgi:Cu(I)/Ag(I) efflux system membrane fusion protein
MNSQKYSELNHIGSSKVSVLVGLVIGAALTAAVYTFILQPNVHSDSKSGADAAKKQPLYWVAPMDPNFKRDQPGQSPMGMDLVPVYADAGDQSDSPGTIKIHPNVVNNLGVRTARAERKSLNVVIKTVGYVQYNEDTLVHVHPRVEGWIEVLNVKAAGAYVKKGEALYALYSPELVNAQEEFLLAVKRSNSNLMAASKSRLQALQMPALAIKKLVAEQKVQQTVVFTAPQTGFIDNLNIREGSYVKPSMTLMSIGALDEMWVDAEVFERQSSLLELGLAVSMTLEYLPGKMWEGKVDYIYPTLDAKTRTLRVRLRFSNEEYFLKPNMFAQVTIFASADKQASANKTQSTQHSDVNIIVPSEAVIRTGGQNRVVLALGEGKFKSIEVEIGRIAEQYTEILSGLKENDLVVTSAQFLLDSESSISSDFKRMGDQAMASEAMQSSSDSIDDMQSMLESSDMDSSADMSSMRSMGAMLKPVWVKASIDDVMPADRMVRLSHGDIDEWGMPGMTMNFVVSDSLDMQQFKADSEAQVQLRRPESGMFEVVGIKP